VGERWEALLVFEGGLTASRSERLERLPSGAVRLAGAVEARISGPERMGVIRCGPLHVFVPDPPEGDGLEGEGRLYEDNHFAYIDEDGFHRWKATGTARRLWVVPGNDGKYADWPDDTGLLKGDPTEVAAIDPRWVGPHHWEVRVEVEVDEVTEGDAIALAEQAARDDGYPLDDYQRAAVTREDGGWRISFALKPPGRPGGHFAVSIDAAGAVTVTPGR